MITRCNVKHITDPSFNDIKDRIMTKAKTYFNYTENDVINDIILAKYALTFSEIAETKKEAYRNKITKNDMLRYEQLIEKVHRNSVQVDNREIRSDLSKQLSALLETKASVKANSKEFYEADRQIKLLQVFISSIDKQITVNNYQKDVPVITDDISVEKKLEKLANDPNLLNVFAAQYDTKQLAFASTIAGLGKQVNLARPFNILRFVPSRDEAGQFVVLDKVALPTFITDKQRRASNVTGQITMSSEQAVVSDVRIFSKEQKAALTESMNVLHDINTAVEGDYKRYSSTQGYEAEKDLRTINELIKNMIENDLYNTVITANHFGTNAKGETYILPKGITINDVDDTFLAKQIELMREQSPVLAKYSNEILIPAFNGALRYRKAYQNEFKEKTLTQVKKNLEVFIEFYDKTDRKQQLYEAKKRLEELGDVGETYVPRTVDDSYLNSELTDNLIVIAENYNKNMSGNSQNEVEAALEQLASKLNLNLDVLQQYMNNFFEGSSYNINLLKLVRVANNEEINDESELTKVAKRLGIIATKQQLGFIMALRSGVSTNINVYWKNAMKRTLEGFYIPTKSNIYELTRDYLMNGLRKVYNERMQYQYLMHREVSTNRERNDRLRDGQDYSDTHAKLWNFIERYVARATGDTHIITKEYVKALNENKTNRILWKFMTRTKMKVVTGLVGNKQQFKNLSNYGEELTVKDVKIYNAAINKFLHFNFLSAPGSAFKNYVGSKMKHWVFNGSTPILKNVKWEEKYQKAGLTSFIDAVKEIDNLVSKNSSDTGFIKGESVDIRTAWNYAKENLTAQSFLEFTLQIKDTSFAGMYFVGSYLFEKSEKFARQEGFKKAYSYAITELNFTEEQAIARAAASVELLDGIYDSTGKVLIADPEISSIVFKYMNYSASQIHWMKEIFFHQHSTEKIYYKDVFTSKTPAGVMFRYGFSQAILFTIDILLRPVGLSIFFFFADDLARFLYQAVQAIWALATGDEEALLKQGKALQRTTPTGLGIGTALSLTGAAIDQSMHGDYKSDRNLSKNRIADVMLNTITPAYYDIGRDLANSGISDKFMNQFGVYRVYEDKK